MIVSHSCIRSYLTNIFHSHSKFHSIMLVCKVADVATASVLVSGGPVKSFPKSPSNCKISLLFLFIGLGGRGGPGVGTYLGSKLTLRKQGLADMSDEPSGRSKLDVAQVNCSVVCLCR